MPKAATNHLVRFRVDLTAACSVGPGKIDLLEAIVRTGSLSKAARELRMSYAYGWLILNDLNRSFGEAVTTATTGGARRGGVQLTAFGHRLVRCYRSASRAIESAVRKELGLIAQKAVPLLPRKSAVSRQRLTRGITLLRSRAIGARA